MVLFLYFSLWDLDMEQVYTFSSIHVCTVAKIFFSSLPFEPMDIALLVLVTFKLWACYFFLLFFLTLAAQGPFFRERNSHTAQQAQASLSERFARLLLPQNVTHRHCTLMAVQSLPYSLRFNGRFNMTSTQELLSINRRIHLDDLF